ncbi:formin-like protein 5 [Iris pallida]|uniref:Formin-like protein 5 n=1 Tax=Iris pallida TaxID=29817 RepID=A0AAX6H2B5_IRIPA|nr:formin-like protein 5 [Iris pallida]
MTATRRAGKDSHSVSLWWCGRIFGGGLVDAGESRVSWWCMGAVVVNVAGDGLGWWWQGIARVVRGAVTGRSRRCWRCSG